MPKILLNWIGIVLLAVILAACKRANVHPLRSAEVYDPASGKWSRAGSMITPRVWFASAGLIVGTLVTGGVGDNGRVLSSAEIFNEFSRRFSATGDMNVPRAHHTATFLSDGSVLIVGGNSAPDRILASAELYKPQTGKFYLTQHNMNVPRWGHTATLLPYGKVLIAGGYTPKGPTTSAEVFNPYTGVFSPVGNMNAARAEHAAALIPGGRVLISGGGTGPDCHTLSSAEIFIPANTDPFTPERGVFQATGDMTEARAAHTMSRLPNGKMLITGGKANEGCKAARALSSAELFDFTRLNFTRIGKMSVARYSHTTGMMPNGDILIAGGFGDDGSGVGRAELYDFRTNSFQPTGSMATGRGFAGGSQ